MKHCTYQSFFWSLALAGGLTPQSVWAAQQFRAAPDFAPRFERKGGEIAVLAAIPGGGYYAAGRFTSIDGATSPSVVRFLPTSIVDPDFNPPVIQDGAIVGSAILAMAVQADGKLIVAGKFTRVGDQARVRIARLLPSGAIDPSFDPGAGFDADVRALAIMSDSRIVVVGNFTSAQGAPRPKVARLLANGALDKTFVPTTALNNNACETVGVQSDGRVLVGGGFSFTLNGQFKSGLVRLDATGAFDATFALPNWGFGIVKKLVVLPDDRYYVGGEVSVATPVARGGVIRFERDGAVDATFNLDFTTRIESFGQHEDGRLTVMTTFPGAAILRVGADGVVDPTFPGIVPFPATPTLSATLLVVPYGQVVVGGDFPSFANVAQPAIARIDGDATIDDSFRPVVRKGGDVRAIVPTSNNGWLAGGAFDFVNGTARRNIARLLPDGSLDLTFDPGTGFDAEVEDLAIQPDGRIVAGGAFTTFAGAPRSRVARLDAAGALDGTFTVGTGFNNTVFALHLQADGRIFVGGNFTSYNGNICTRLARLLADGTFDATTDANLAASDVVRVLVGVPSGSGFYVGGRFTSINGNSRYLIARLGANGALDAAFNLGESIFADTGTLGIQPLLDGRIVIGGEFIGVGSVMRLLANGTRDTTFTPSEPVSQYARGVAVMDDGTVLGVGRFPATSGGPDHSLLKRWSPTGIVESAPIVTGLIEAGIGRRLIKVSNTRYMVAGEWTYFTDRVGGGLIALTPDPVPVIVTAPVTTSVSLGGSATFRVVATGADLHYQWLRDGVEIPGATGDSLVLNPVVGSDAGAYSVRVFNNYGSLTTAPVLLSGNDPLPAIVTPVANVTVTAGADAVLSVTATGVGILTYQWRRSGQAIEGATASLLHISHVTMDDAGLYEVVVRDGLMSRSGGVGRVVVLPYRFGGLFHLDPGFAPRFERDGGSGSLVAAAPDGGFFVYGTFSTIAERPAWNLARFRANGAIEPSFTAPVFVQDPMDAQNDPLIAVLAVQPDGKLLIGGAFTQVDGQLRPNLARLNPDGTLDASFQIGLGFAELSGAGALVTTIVIEPDGRIVIGGRFNSYQGNTAGNLVRLLANGDYDATLDTQPGFIGAVYAVARRSDGGFVVTGNFAQYDDVPTTQFVQLTSTGARVTGFATSVFNGGVNDIEVLPDNRVLLAGSFDNVNGLKGLIRLTANGTFDTSFVTPFIDHANITGLHLFDDGRIMVTGSFYVSRVGAQLSLVRLLADGARDTSFEPFSGEVNSFTMLTSGDVVMSGAFDGSSSDGARPVARLTSAGARVTAFTPRARFPVDLSHATRAPGGRWIVMGQFRFASGVLKPAIARLNADGSCDASFTLASGWRVDAQSPVVLPDGGFIATGGYVPATGPTIGGLVAFDAAGQPRSGFGLPVAVEGGVGAIAVQPDGGILVAGGFSAIGGVARPGLARVLPNGTVDPAFVPAGKFNQPIAAMVLQPDGRILVGGGFTSFGPTARTFLARLNEDGSLDMSFNPGAAFIEINDRFVSHLLLRANSSIDAAGSFGVRRFLADGTPDPAFAVVYTPLDPISTIAQPNAGDVLVAGAPVFSQLAETFVSRILATGIKDDAFSVADPLDIGARAVNDLHVLEDGSIVVAGSFLHFPARITGGLARFRVEPYLVSKSGDAILVAGNGHTLSANFQSTLPLTYQWYLDGVAVAGATSASYTILVAQRFSAGIYTVLATSSMGSALSDPIVVDVNPAPPSPDSRLLNLSTRALCQTGDNVLIPGFVISGTASKKLLIRAVGPTLGLEYFVAGALPNPRIVVKRHNSATNTDVDIASNDNWGAASNFAAIKQTAARVFAFPIPDESLDAALLLDLEPGQYTAIVDGVAGATGVAIAELYDADADGSGSRLINISNRGYAGVGGEVMIPGFVVSTEGPKTFLIRAVGPTIAGAPYNVPGTMVDPKLIVYRTNPQGPSTEILSQDNWGENPDAAYTAQIAAQLSAFPLASGSKDAAFVVTLPPGGYTVHGKSADGSGTGVMLVEVYVVE